MTPTTLVEIAAAATSAAGGLWWRVRTRTRARARADAAAAAERERAAWVWVEMTIAAAIDAQAEHAKTHPVRYDPDQVVRSVEHRVECACVVARVPVPLDLRARVVPALASRKAAT